MSRIVDDFKGIAAVVALLATGLVANPAGAQKEAGPKQVAELGGDLFMGEPILAENITAWPVYSKKPAVKVGRDFIPLADAQEKKLAVVKEVGVGAAGAERPPVPGRSRNRINRVQRQQVALSADGEPSGTVNELVIENKGDKPILVLAGTLLKGGKQDRQVGQDFIVPPKKTVPVAAFCVEHGRWTANREGKNTGGVFHAKKILAVKGVRSKAQYKKNQGEVWEQVAKENRKAGKAPSSGTFMATVEETDKQAVARRDKLYKAVAGRFESLAGQKTAPVGVAYSVDGKVREVRTFTHPLIFQRFTETLVTTIAMEGDLAQREAKAQKRAIYRKKADSRQVLDLVKGAEKITMKKARTKAGNVIGERRSDKYWNANCYEDEDQKTPVTQSYMNAE